MEQAYLTLRNAGLEYTNDGVIQISNYANLAADMGEPLKAIEALNRCAMAVREYNFEYCGDYANLQWDIGCLYLRMNDTEQAAIRFKTALDIYTEIWRDEPELIDSKVKELQSYVHIYQLVDRPLLQVV